MKQLFKKPTALAFLAAIFLNAFVDLGHKIVIQNTIFKVYDGPEQLILTAIVNALILLPFILLFSPAGFCSDRFPKHKVMRVTAWAAVALTVGITVAYAMGWFWLAFAMTFLLATQSAFYSPAKLGYIRGFFGKDKLAAANGVVSATTIIAILLGTFIFSIGFEWLLPESAQTESDIVGALVPIGVVLIANALLEVFVIYKLPNVDAANDAPETSLNGSTTTRSLKGLPLKNVSLMESLNPVLKRETIRLSILGLAMFWSVGQVMLAAFPAFAKATTGEMNTVFIQVVLASSGLGIAIGSVIASRISRNHIETGLIPIGAMGLSIGLLTLPHLDQLSFMALDFLFIGTMGGLFIVPLNALIQFNAPKHELGKVLAGNNLFQNISMFTFLVITVAFALTGLTSKQLLIFAGCFALCASFYTIYRLPQSLVRIFLTFVMSCRYKLNVQGMKNIPSTGGALLLGNHISWIDWAIVQLACPRPVQFVMLKSIYDRWYLSWFFKLCGCVPIQQGASSKASLATVAKLLDEGKVVCLFPEGGISRTGQLAEFRRGFEKIADLSELSQDEPQHKPYRIVPFYLRGLWGSQWSRSSKKFRELNRSFWSRDLIVAFGQEKENTADAAQIKQAVFDLSIQSWQTYTESLETLPEALIRRCKRQPSKLAIADTSGTELSYARALTAALCFAKRIKKLSTEQNVGILLPTSAGGVLANMGALLAGKTLVNLNYTASREAMQSAIKQADIKTVYSSPRFIKKLQARGIDTEALLEGTRVIWLEDLKEEISKFEYLVQLAVIRSLPTRILKWLIQPASKLDDCAAILFSSGSEGAPKGVQLSHQNILANVKQISSVLNMQNDDVMVASLPLFHAFGLTVTQFLPLIEGLPMVCHPDPTDALGISKAVAKYRASIMCGTSTFLRLYCRNNKVHPLMLDSLRLVISGAEKLNPEVRDAFEAKFNKRVLEGYGATETTPVASVNLPDMLDHTTWKPQVGSRAGTVGLPLPGTSFKIVDPESFEELEPGQDGMILIGGAQVMMGYLNNAEKTESAVKYIDGQRWYVSGDKGHVDSDGFLTIVDRYSRFAKLGGEMISLSAIESAIVKAFSAQFSELEVVAVNLPDDKKGERIIALANHALSESDVREALQSAGHSALMAPSKLLHVEDLPKLGSGKTDFSAAKALALNAI